MGLGLDMLINSPLIDLGDIRREPTDPLIRVAGVLIEFSLEPINDLIAEAVSLPALEPSLEAKVSLLGLNLSLPP